MADNVDFNFITIQQPKDTRNATYRKQVRSHVTRLQHYRSRQQAASGTSTPKPDPIHPRGCACAACKPARATRQRRPVVRSSKDGKDSSLAVSGIGSSFSNGSKAFTTFALDDSMNVVGTTLARLRLHASTVLACHEAITAVQAHDFEQQFAAEPGSIVQRGASAGRFLAFIWRDPALLAMIMLVTTTFLLDLRERKSGESDELCALQLRGFMLSSINKALEDGRRAISDPMLVAVALFAAYELKRGSVEAYHIHMNGLVKMINARGGLPELGRTDPYLERMLLWNDANTAALAGCTPYCDRVEVPSKIHYPKPDPDMFRMVSSEYDRPVIIKAEQVIKSEPQD